MNFIFDIGNVLVDFKPKEFLHSLLDNPADEAKIFEIIFKSREWIQMDLGLLSPQEARADFCLREPNYRKTIEKTMDQIPEMLTQITRTAELLPKIKAAGHKLYYLSNYPRELSFYIRDRYSFFELFEGGLFSWEIHALKPSAEIYHALLDRYSLNPKDCLFFDDMEINVAAAEELGIKSVLFTDAQVVLPFI